MIMPNILIQYVWDSPFCVLRGQWSKFLNFYVFMPLKIVFVIVSCADSDEMPPSLFANFVLSVYWHPE